ncbi:SIR2 family protein [Vallitalea longa]|uniref:SIR2 family protein n=1 Tax=Vallitalea longa TaxID=2936439 RepID=A0A9W5YFH6_9FIRM|nr:SIR2 family protein [Vallitalea longa]GKX31358.1 SIR2 family protein [Vallitalea longa]
MEKINVLHQMNELKKILSYSKNIGFFFGAGTSCAFGLPNISNLTQGVEDSLEPSLKDEFIKVRESLTQLIGKSIITIEDILNYIRQIRDITHEKDDREHDGISGVNAKQLDLAICRCIFDIIKGKEGNADITDIQKFLAWYDTSNRNYVKEIFTTNYDMLLEKAMEVNCIPYFDGFVGSYEPFFWPESIDKFVPVSELTGNWIRLWKIHGSLNWESKGGLNGEPLKIIRAGKIDEPQNEILIYPSKEKYNLSRKQPFIAYFDRLKNYLLRGELLFIFSGYSFFDQHINDVVFNCLRQNARLYAVVLCFSDEQVEFMQDFGKSYLNLCVMGPTKAIVNGNLCEWSFDDAEDDNDKSEFYWNEIDKNFTLGDFKKLIDFLIENSGRRSIIEEAIHAK